MSPRQVLLVEDDEQLIRIMERWLVDDGYDVVPCAKFESARTYLINHRPDILITDVRLGAFNGLQLLLLAKSLNPATVAVVTSGFADPVLREEAERAGACYLQKPLRREQLLACMPPRTDSL